jgi:peptide chain release factor 1
MLDKLEAVVRRYESLTEKMSDPTLYERPEELRKLTTERANIEPIVHAFKDYKRARENLTQAKDMLMNESDEMLKEMAREDVSLNEGEIARLEQEIRLLLLPKDPLDDKDVIVEIRAGAGGDEASIFVGDMYRMYQYYFKTLGFKVENISASEGDQGLKEVIFKVTGDKVYSKLKWESGVHRVQRVPKTETQGRIHTSTITVAVMPEADEVDFKLDLNEVRIDVYRSSGAGGQSVNTTDSAVRVTHIPTGISVACQQERSQLKNKERGLQILRARIFDKMVSEQQAKEAAERKGLVGTGDRSERIRTYNYPQGRISDHRIGLTIYNLPAVMEGDMAEITDSLVAHHQAELLKGQED